MRSPCGKVQLDCALEVAEENNGVVPDNGALALVSDLKASRRKSRRVQ
jgi:hypothetical protein